MSNDVASQKGAYSRILRSSSIVASSQAVNYLVSLARSKVAAILLGTAGVGVVGVYTNLITLITSVAGMGISSSGVREIARERSAGDSVGLARIIQTIGRSCWLTGLVGWLCTAALSWPISVWFFGDPLEAWSITLLGAAVLLTALSGGRVAVIQGMRRMGDLAWITIGSSVIGTLAVILIYWRAGAPGIVPAMIVAAAIKMLVSEWFARRVKTVVVKQSWRESVRAGKDLFVVGGAIMWGSTVVALAEIGIRAIVVREISLEDAGVYQAAWSISGMFAGFILSAMGADFLPGLASKIDDAAEANRMVNQQTEIGVLLSLPGLLCSLLFAPFLILFFYTSEFSEGARLLPWFVVGIFVRVISWPMGFLLIAKGASRWYIFTQSQFAAVHLALAYYLVDRYDLIGVGVAFPVVMVVAMILNLLICFKLTRFRWSIRVLRLIGVSVLFVCAALIAKSLLAGWGFVAAALAIVIASAVYCVRVLGQRLGLDHRLVRLALRVPGLKYVCGL